MIPNFQYSWNSQLDPRFRTQTHVYSCRIVSTGFSSLPLDTDDADIDMVRTSANLENMGLAGGKGGTGGHSGEMDPRIGVSPALLIDMLTCLYYIMWVVHCGFYCIVGNVLDWATGVHKWRYALWVIDRILWVVHCGFYCIVGNVLGWATWGALKKFCIMGNLLHHVSGALWVLLHCG